MKTLFPRSEPALSAVAWFATGSLILLGCELLAFQFHSAALALLGLLAPSAARGEGDFAMLAPIFGLIGILLFLHVFRLIRPRVAPAVARVRP